MDDIESTSNKVVAMDCNFRLGRSFKSGFNVVHLVECAAWSYHMRRRMHGFTVLSLLLPWTKHPAKILCSCQVVITVPTMISIPSNFIQPDIRSPF